MILEAAASAWLVVVVTATRTVVVIETATGSVLVSAAAGFVIIKLTAGTILVICSATGFFVIIETATRSVVVIVESTARFLIVVELATRTLVVIVETAARALVVFESAFTSRGTELSLFSSVLFVTVTVGNLEGLVLQKLFFVFHSLSGTRTLTSVFFLCHSIKFKLGLQNYEFPSKKSNCGLIYQKKL